MHLYHLHPVVVHFPVALLLLGLAVGLLGLRPQRAGWLDTAAAWLLWIGTATLWVALALGLVAQRTAPHVPLAWETLSEHKALGFWTAGAFTALALLRRFAPPRLRPWLVFLWAGAAVLLVDTAYHGSELVYVHGMGVVPGE